MKHLITLFVSLLVHAFMLAGVVASPAVAQDKMKDAKTAMAEKGKAVVKVLLENDKVRVLHATYRPGDENPLIPYPSFRVVHALKGGTIQHNYADGKTQKVEWKTGEVRFLDPDKPFAVKNIGKTEVVLYVVVLKQPK